MKRNMPVNIFTEDVIILTETFLLQETELQGYYNHHILAKQGLTGRPSGGISCFFQPWLAPSSAIQITPNLLIIQLKGIAVVSGYYQPECTVQEIIEDLTEAFNKIENQQPVIVAGDFNCRIDKENQKTRMLVNYIVEEGFSLLNNPNEPTYICHNGRSTIDLIFRNPWLETKSIKILADSATVPLRKHQPVIASVVQLKPTRKEVHDSPPMVQRTLNEETLQDNLEELPDIRNQMKQPTE